MNVVYHSLYEFGVAFGQTNPAMPVTAPPIGTTVMHEGTRYVVAGLPNFTGDGGVKIPVDRYDEDEGD